MNIPPRPNNSKTSILVRHSQSVTEFLQNLDCPTACVSASLFFFIKKSSIFLLLKSHICHPHKSVNRTTSRQFLSQSWYNLKNLLTTIIKIEYLCVWKALLAAHLVQTLVLVVKTKLDQFPPCGQNLIIS